MELSKKVNYYRFLCKKWMLDKNIQTGKNPR